MQSQNPNLIRSFSSNDPATQAMIAQLTGGTGMIGGQTPLRQMMLMQAMMNQQKPLFGQAMVMPDLDTNPLLSSMSGGKQL